VEAASIPRGGRSVLERSPVAPLPEKNEWPFNPDPSITPSSASTESTRPANPGGIT